MKNPFEMKAIDNNYHDVKTAKEDDRWSKQERFNLIESTYKYIILLDGDNKDTKMLWNECPKW